MRNAADLSEATRAAAAFSPVVMRGLTRASLPADAAGRIADVARLVSDRRDATLGDAFDAAETLLRRTYRSEYVFKNDIVSRVVFGRHSPRTASALPEFPMGSSFADLLVVNGTTTVYEIKTDLDRLDRLETQLHDYSTRAERVYVVVSEARAATLEEHVPVESGLLALGPRGSLRTVRPAPSNLDRLLPTHLFDMLRVREAFDVLRRLEGWIPPANEAEAWHAARARFGLHSAEALHAEAVRQLHARAATVRQMLSLGAVPASLRSLAYGQPYSRVGAARANARLNSPAKEFTGMP